MTRFRIARAIAAPLLTASSLLVASGAPAAEPAANRLTAWRFEPDRHAVALTVGGPVTVSTRSLSNPPRLVVDIPKTQLVRPKIAFVPQDSIVAGVRMAQYRVSPPIVRVVVDLHPGPEPVMAVQQQGGVLFLTFARLGPEFGLPAVPPSPVPPPQKAAPTPPPAPPTPDASPEELFAPLPEPAPPEEQPSPIVPPSALPAPSPIAPPAAPPVPPRAAPASTPSAPSPAAPPAVAGPSPVVPPAALPAPSPIAPPPARTPAPGALPSPTPPAERETFPAWPD